MSVGSRRLEDFRSTSISARIRSPGSKTRSTISWKRKPPREINAIRNESELGRRCRTPNRALVRRVERTRRNMPNDSTQTTSAQAQSAMNGIAPQSKRRKTARKRVKRAPAKQSRHLQPRTAEDVANEQ